MINPKTIINTYLNNIEAWEQGIDLKEWEKNYIAGQRHACEQILECIEKDKVPTWWPAK